MGKLLTESSGSAPRTFSSSSLFHEIIYESVGTKRPIGSTNSISGNAANMKSSVRAGAYVTQGVIAVQASPKELTRWLPRIFGGTISGTTVSLSNTLPTFDVLVYRENGIYQYTDAVVAQAVLRGKTTGGGEQIDFMDFIIQIVGKQELINTATWPATDPTIAVTADNLPYTFYETTLTLNTLPVEYEEIAMVVNNNLDVKHYNKQYPSCIRMTNRQIELSIKAASTCDNLSTALSQNTATGSGVFSLTTTNMSTVFTFDSLRNAFETSTINGKVIFPQKLSIEAFSAAADGVNVAITHDATP